MKTLTLKEAQSILSLCPLWARYTLTEKLTVALYLMASTNNHK